MRHLKPVYFANIKKVAGGSNASEELIRKAATESADLLLRQISFVAPDMVLCCGGLVYKLIKEVLRKREEVFEELMTEGGLTYIWWGRLTTRFVKYHHPGAYYPREMSYTYLINEVKNLVKGQDPIRKAKSS